MKITRYGFASNSKTSNRLLLVLIVILMIPVFFVSRTLFTSLAQTKARNEKEIKKLNSDNDPIEIVSVGNSKNLVKLGEKFTQDADWLNDFTLNVKNKSDKTITYIRTELDFPETKSSGNIMSYPLTYGVSPLSPNKNSSEKPVEPNENVELKLNGKKFEGLKSFVERRHLLDSLNKVDIRIVFVVFADGTGWSVGHLVKPDPNDPKKYIPSETINIGGN